MRAILLPAFFMVAAFSLSASSKDDTMSFKDSFKTDDKTTMDTDFNSTFDKSKEKNETVKPAVKIQEILKKDPEAAKKLEPQLKELNKLLSEAKRYKNTSISKPLEQLVNSIKIMQLYHNGKDVKDDALANAYNNLTSANSTLARVKMQLEIAKRNTPQIRKIREFQRTASDCYSRSATAAALGQNAKAEYYRTCAKINETAALSYAKNPKIEATAKTQLQKAQAKYNRDETKESAARFRERAESERNQGNDARAEYYDKVANLKDRLSKAYAENNSNLVKSILKEYRKLQADAPM